MPDYTIKSGGRLLYIASHYRQRRKPAVVLGTFADETPCVLVRLYAEHAPGELAITNRPATFTVSEFDAIVARWLSDPERRAAVMARLPLPDGGLP